MRKIIFGIRKSRLAHSQLNEFIAYLESNKLTFDYSIKTIMTEADKDQASPVHEMGRGVFVKEIEPDLEVLPLRGNVDTRVSKMAAGAYDAVVLAACGLQRLEYAKMIRRYFDPDTFVPAAGQGIICGQIRGDDAVLSNALKNCSCVDTEIAALAERKVLKVLEVGCQKPFGVYARFENGEFIITAKAY
ncbi:MAG: hypothetical protein Q8O41_04265, partial [Candidatus Methanoperedens sp.]|nr:hypothetical protein [Candidatus Methanoperedens sp.]